jgi:hypothetical protein
MSPNIGIGDSDRQSVVTILNTVLADEYVLYTKTRNIGTSSVPSSTTCTSSSRRSTRS